MPRGQSPNSRRAWERNRKFGQIRFAIGMILTLGTSGILTPQEVSEAITPLQKASSRYQTKKD